MKEKLVSAKDFVARNKMKIVATIAVTATAVAVVEQIAIRQHNQFLEEKGLTEEFYAVEED